MASGFGLEEGDKRVPFLTYIEQNATEINVRSVASLPLEFLEALVKELVLKKASGTAAAQPAVSSSLEYKRLQIATPSDAVFNIPQLLVENPSLHEFDEYKDGVADLLAAHQNTPLELAASLMRQRLSTEVRRLLDRKATIMVEVPAVDPKHAKELLVMPYRAQQEADAASLPQRVAAKDEKEKIDPWRAGVRVVRMVDSPAAILDWLVSQYAIVEDDRVAEFVQRLFTCDYKSSGSLDSLMQQIDDAARKICEHTQGKTDLREWNKGSHLTHFLMMTLPTSEYAELNTFLFQDGCREWSTIRKRAHDFAARQRIDGLAANPGSTLSAMAVRRRTQVTQQGGGRGEEGSRGDRGNRGGRRGRWHSGHGQPGGKGGQAFDPDAPGQRMPQSFKDTRICFYCDEEGHIERYCPKRAESEEDKRCSSEKKFASATVMLLDHEVQKLQSQARAAAQRMQLPTVTENVTAQRTGRARTEARGASSTTSRTSTPSSTASSTQSGASGSPRRASWGEGREGIWLVRSRRGVRPEAR
jgi:hypothetical protein